MNRVQQNVERLLSYRLIRFFVMHTYDRLPPALQQIARFLVTGGMNAVFGYFVFSTGYLLLNLSMNHSIYLSYMFGVCFSYMAFRTFVFTGGDRSFHTFLRFVPTYAFLLWFNLNAMQFLAGRPALVGNIKWNTMLNQAFVTGLCAVMSFFINSLFIFRGKGRK